MAIGYTWNVSTVDTYPTLDSNADVVYNVHWRLTAEDDANQDADGNNWTATPYGTQSVDTSDLSSFTAIVYAEYSPRLSSLPSSPFSYNWD